MTAAADLRQALIRDGFAIVEDVIDANHIRTLITQLKESEQQQETSRAASVHARRNLLRLPFINDLANSPLILALIESVIGSNALPVRGLFFDKTPDANWKVAWHQDLSIAVHRKIDIPGFGPWSTKDGIVHVQPPVEVLQQMLTLRLHLDDCDDQNGPLKVFPRSHQQGILRDDQIAAARQQMRERICCVKSGGVLLMRPLILHASSTSIRPVHRRVIHLEYSAANLPSGLKWHEEAIRDR